MYNQPLYGCQIFLGIPYVKKIKLIILTQFILLLISQYEYAQSTNMVIYPKVDIHIGMSFTKGTYIGSTVKVSDKYSLETSFGSNYGLLIVPVDPQRRYSLGINYHLDWPIILNTAYIFKNGFPYGFSDSHVITMNVGALSLQNIGFHLIINAGLFYEYEYNSDVNRNIYGVNFNLGIGFTFL